MVHHLITQEVYSHKIHQPIEVGPVQSRHLQSGLGEEHAEGADEVLAQRLAKRAVRPLVLGPQLVVARLLAELAGLEEEDLGGVRLGEEEAGQDLDEGVGDADGPEDPSPVQVLGEIAGGWDMSASSRIVGDRH